MQLSFWWCLLVSHVFTYRKKGFPMSSFIGIREVKTGVTEVYVLAHNFPVFLTKHTFLQSHLLLELEVSRREAVSPGCTHGSGVNMLKPRSISNGWTVSYGIQAAGALQITHQLILVSSLSLLQKEDLTGYPGSVQTLPMLSSKILFEESKDNILLYGWSFFKWMFLIFLFLLRYQWFTILY